MEYTTLGDTGLRVSRLCLGCATFGSGRMPNGDWEWTVADEDRALAVIDRAIDRGINFLDTANTYSSGDSERLVGRAVAGRRDDLVLASKVGGPTGDGPNRGGLSRKHVRAQLAGSLERLGTEYLDVYYSHAWDDETPIGETMATFDALRREGRIDYAGASNLSGSQLLAAQATSDRRGLAPYACLQPEYSLVARGAESGVLPVADDRGLGVTTYSPLGAGFLAERFERGETPPPGSRLAEHWDRWDTDARWTVLDRVRAVADARDATPVQVSVAWLLERDAVDVVLVGPETVAQLDEYLGSLDVSLTREDRSFLAAPLADAA